MSSKAKKIAAAATAVALSASLLLGGTYAWQSVNQVALNEASDVVNPGGRLHDDFNGDNKDIYVENFAEEDIFARVRLEEFFAVVMNHGTSAETADVVAGSADYDTTTHTFSNVGYETHKFGQENLTDAYWDWATGGQTTFMPTFNKNKDSLQADVNGVYNAGLGVISNRDLSKDYYGQYDGYVDYSDAANSTKPANEIYDADSNGVDELYQIADINDVINGEDYSAYTDNIVVVEGVEHKAKLTANATLMSMQEWIDAGSQPGPYWVYDIDGWVYWADAIPAGEATGLLLDGISLDGVMDDTWYYAINVVAQFVTADDVGKADNSGFYDTTDGYTIPSDNAVKLLEAAGVQFGDEEQPPVEEEPEDAPVFLTINGVTYTPDDTITLKKGSTMIYCNVDAYFSSPYTGDIGPNTPLTITSTGTDFTATVTPDDTSIAPAQFNIVFTEGWYCTMKYRVLDATTNEVIYYESGTYNGGTYNVEMTTSQKLEVWDGNNGATTKLQGELPEGSATQVPVVSNALSFTLPAGNHTLNFYTETDNENNEGATLILNVTVTDDAGPEDGGESEVTELNVSYNGITEVHPEIVVTRAEAEAGMQFTANADDVQWSFDGNEAGTLDETGLFKLSPDFDGKEVYIIASNGNLESYISITIVDGTLEFVEDGNYTVHPGNFYLIENATFVDENYSRSYAYYESGTYASGVTFYEKNNGFVMHISSDTSAEKVSVQFGSNVYDEETGEYSEDIVAGMTLTVEAATS